MLKRAVKGRLKYPVSMALVPPSIYVEKRLMIIHEYYTFAPNREALERHFFIRNGNTKAVILVGSARARYFALWHVVRSQATGTGVPLRIFQMSPADDRL